MSGNKALAAGFFISTIAFIVTIIFNALAGVGQKEIFNERTSDVSKQFPTVLTPAGWTFSIWSVIYIWISMSFTYLIVNIYRKKHNDPIVFSLTMCVVFIINMILNVAWLFLWDKKNVVASTVFLFLVVMSNWILLGILSRRLFAKASELNVTDKYLYILLPQNGLATYTTWTTLASLVNLSIAIKYGGEVRNDSLGDLISLGLLSFLLLVWLPLENYKFFEPLQYVFTPYFVVVWTLVGIFSKLNSTDRLSVTGVYVGVLLGVCSLLLLIRLLFIVYTHFKGHPFKKTISSTFHITNYKS